MDEKDMISGLTEAYIRQLAGEQSFKRGMNYYIRGAIREPVRQGALLWGKCDGSQDEPYTVGVMLGENGISEAYCTCPRGGFCKHIVALLLTYIHEPEIFRDIDSFEAKLASLSKEELVALIMKIIQREPSLLGMLEREVATPSDAPVDIASVRRQVWRALRHNDPDYVVLDLRDILNIAEKLAQKGERMGAGTVYREVLDALVASYEDELQGIDYDGTVAAIACDCVEGLRDCLDEGVIGNDTRQGWLATLMDAELADIKMGGVDFASGAFDIIIEQATEEEWPLLEERVRKLIPDSDDWERERLVNILVTWREKYGRYEEACRIIRELGTVEQYMFLLVREGKLGEAVAVAKEHFTKMPGIILNLARALADAGEAGYGVELLTQLANLEESHPGYLEWLAEYYRKNGDLEAALKWQLAFFRQSPTVKTYAALCETGKRLGVWEKVRKDVLKELEDNNNFGRLIEIALHEGDVGRALELLPRVPVGGWHNYRAEVARAAEKKQPLDAIALYKEMVKTAISWRQRKTYRQAAEFLRRIKGLYERLGNRGEWEKYLDTLRKEYARLPALLDELNKAGL
ncbi:MAG: SWIM zinc finger family protein [Moorella sp. (in: firmicutes)]